GGARLPADRESVVLARAAARRPGRAARSRYWGADRSAGSPGGRAAINAQALGTVRLRAPTDTAYRTITADTLDTIGTRYQGFADVTPIVSAAGAGEYTIANVQAGTGPDRYAGW